MKKYHMCIIAQYTSVIVFELGQQFLDIISLGVLSKLEIYTLIWLYIFELFFAVYPNMYSGRWVQLTTYNLQYNDSQQGRHQPASYCCLSIYYWGKLNRRYFTCLSTGTRQPSKNNGLVSQRRLDGDCRSCWLRQVLAVQYEQCQDVHGS